MENTSISVMLKPASGLCNMNCNYCFYEDETNSRGQKNYGMMDISLAKSIFDKINSYANNEKYVVFQGGEPLLRGYKFYEEILEYGSKYNIDFSIQTNGLLLDDKFCKLFKKYNVLVGLSLDGNEKWNYNRLIENKNSFNNAYLALDLLKKYDIEHNILVVVTNMMANNIKEVFDYFVSINEKSLQFIPCLSNLKNNDLAMNEKSYGKFLCDLFDCYYNEFKNNNYVSIRNMDNYVLLAKHHQAEQCGMNGRCHIQYAIEANGNVYPCDFYCTDENLLGNINESNFNDFYNKSIEFVQNFPLKEKCKACRYYQLCKGGCKRENESFSRCAGQIKFFDYAINRLKEMGDYFGL